jgi:hypothetical protein
MAFRTVVGQDYKAKNALDSFIEGREERSRTSKRIESSLAHNAAQAAVLVKTLNDARDSCFVRYMHGNAKKGMTGIWFPCPGVRCRHAQPAQGLGHGAKGSVGC